MKPRYVNTRFKFIREFKAIQINLSMHYFMYAYYKTHMLVLTHTSYFHNQLIIIFGVLHKNTIFYMILYEHLHVNTLKISKFDVTRKKII